MKIGVVCGSFDLIHIGHINLLKKAYKHCDKLIVGVNSDNRIKAAKGHDPIQNEKDRLSIIKEFKIVYDAYIIENGISLVQKLLESGINVSEYYRGDDNRHLPEQKIENDFLKSIGIKPVYFQHTPNIHSAILREKIK
ncbi:MAG: adenylyltransferase/cytidyltransferase family protein [Alphaproteobacteria bacterium]|nr:adenylyltransferase/cytidyltransferase family protein [Alphaproteobacteria bacterium]